MSKKRKRTIRDVIKSEIRKEQKDCGFFDGRFRTKVESTKKTYNRKNKHKNKRYD